MSDSWLDDMHEANYGGMTIDVIATDDDFGRGLQQTQFYGRSGGLVRDLGGNIRSTRCDVIFMGDSIKRVARFKKLIDDGKPKTFIHPLFGVYTALPGDVGAGAGADVRDWISISVTFYESSLEVSPLSSRTSPEANADMARAELEAALLAMAASSLTIDETKRIHDELNGVEPAIAGTPEAVRSSDVVISQRKANLLASELVEQLEEEITRLELAGDVSFYPQIIAFRRLQYETRRLAEYVINRNSRSLTTYEVKQSAPLLAIAQQLYGGAEGVERFNELRELNDLATPGLVPAGTVLRVYSS